MKFPRNARIFRGQLDASPFVGVLFLVAIFLLLNSSMVFLPGVPVQLLPEGNFTNATGAHFVATVEGADRIHYENRLLKEEEFKLKLAEDVSRTPTPATLLLLNDPMVKNELLIRLRDMARDLHLMVETPGARIELPEAGDLPGIAGNTVVVVVNLGGQIFYASQLIGEDNLRSKLETAVRQSRAPLTLVLAADRAVDYGLILRLELLAQKAGIKQVWRATRPPVVAGRSNATR